MKRLPLLALALRAAIVLVAPPTIAAEKDGPIPIPPAMNLPGLPGADNPFGIGDGLAAGPEGTFTGQFRVQQGGREGVLEIKAVLAPDWHTYALDQQGGPRPSKITVTAGGPVEVLAPFQPDRAPKVRTVKEFDVPVREHYGAVTWTAPIRIAGDADPAQARLEVVFDGLLCHDVSGCKPMFNHPITVVFGGFYTPAPAAKTPAGAPRGDYRPERSHLAFRGYVEPAVVVPGGKLTLVLTAVCDSDWHIYAYARRDPQQVAKPTLIVLTEPAGWSLGEATASAPPTVKPAEAGVPEARYHAGSVTWTAELQTPRDVPPGEVRLSGLVGYQTCTNQKCDAPKGVRFSVAVTIGTAVSDEPRSLAFAEARYAEAARAAAANAGGALPDPPAAPLRPAPGPGQAGTPSSAALDLDKLAVQREQDMSLIAILGVAFLGGFILNFMPCVLPVIGLKVVSFVQQAGESRGRVFALNVWYAAGLLSVFMALAAAVAVWNEGWGAHFSSEGFVITMTAVVFTMGLSFLGVWEIPIPGFVGTGKANELAEREGPAGAFFKGIITTLLATPCSGPGLATALTWCNGKAPALVYTVFAVMGLGMALPYLVIGANPKLIRILPKPGAWMETFKQTMGFVLLGTVIYLLTVVPWALVLPVLTLLFALWAACWWVGRVPITAGFQVKARAWLLAAAFAALAGLYAFNAEYGLRGIMEYRLTAYVDRLVQKHVEQAGLSENEEGGSASKQDAVELPWEPYTTEKLRRLTAENKTVLVDFTADWCMTCKFLESTVLNTAAVRRVVDENRVVTLVANWTDHDPEISAMLERLGSKQVPVIAIFPAGQPNAPLVLMGGYTQKTLLAKLQDAGPSRGT